MAANLRLGLVITLVFLAYLLWMAWQRDYAPQAAKTPPVATEAAPVAQANRQAVGADVPTAVMADLPEKDSAAQAQPANQPSQPLEPAVTVVTDVLRLSLSPSGNVLEAWLLDYPVDVDEPTDPYQLMAKGGGKVFIAQTGLLSESAQVPNHSATFQAAKPRYELQPGQEQLTVPLVWSQGELRVVKTYTLTRGSYVIEVELRVENAGGQPLALRQYRQLQRTPRTEGGGFSFTNPASTSYLGAAVYSPEEGLIQVDFEQMQEPGVFHSLITGGWAAMVQHYFFSAWIPDAKQTNAYYSKVYQPGGLPRYIIGAMTPEVTVPSGAQHVFESRLFVGPKLQDKLEDIAPGLGLTVDYGIFTILAQPLFWLLSLIQNFVGNWGWAIIIVTILIKAVFYKLTEAQYKSMAKLRKVQPRMKALKERFGDDKQKLNQAMMELYKKEKVNPLGSCLPMLVQIPFLIAFYWVLLESVELRQAPWILWINDLSAPDPYYILPLIMGASMFVQQKMSPMPATDPMQEKIMMGLPFIFTIMFAFFASGLVLYWTVNNILSVAQQWFINKRMDGS